MVDLNNLIICPACHTNLPLENIRYAGSDCCPQCGRHYTFEHGVYNMTPLPPPDEVLKSKWEIWEKLQDNGLRSYTAAPEYNLSIGEREDAQAFKRFCQSSGLILDIGCGPQTYPSYLPETSAVVGIDPLVGHQPRGFNFVQGIGEYLPFRDETFDHILYGSSLDHIINPKRSLADAVRCLKPGGHLNLWIDGLGNDDASANASQLGQYQTLVKKGVKSMSRHGWFVKMGLRRFLSYVSSVARMEVPEGASDYFHFVHLNVATVFGWLTELNLSVTRQQEYPAADSVFIQARK